MYKNIYKCEHRVQVAREEDRDDTRYAGRGGMMQTYDSLEPPHDAPAALGGMPAVVW